MKFMEQVKWLRKQRQMPQRQLAAALEIDTATYCKIEKGERRVKGEQVVVIAKLLQVDKNELHAFWLADQVTKVVKDEQKVADRALNIAKKR